MTELWWGEDLISTDGGWVPYDGFEIRVMATDFDFGSPQPLTTEVGSQLFDGELVEVTGHGNREQSLQIQVRASDGHGLAAGEQMIVPKVGGRSEIKWVPPLAPVEPVIFEILTSSLHGITNDVNEMRGIRAYNVRLTARPWVRSEEEVISYALDTSATTPTTSLVDSGSSAASWTGTVAGATATLTASSGVGVDVAALRTNLVRDPRFTTPSAWTTLSSGARFGTDASIPAARVSRVGSGAILFAPAPAFCPTVVAGVTYTFSYRLTEAFQITSGGRLIVQWLNAAGGVVSTFQSSALGANPTGYASATGVAPAGAVRAQPRLSLTASIPFGAPLHLGMITVSQPLVEASSIRSAYFDGDSPTAGGVGYRWSNVANASTSVQMPAGAISLQRNGSVDFTTTPYLVVDFNAPPGDAATISAWIGGTPVQRLGLVQTGIASFRATFATPGAVTSSIGLILGRDPSILGQGDELGPAPFLFRIARLERSDMPQAYLGTGRQTMRSMDVAGTAPTEGKLYLGHDTTGLGPVHVYVGPADGFQPPCSRFLTAGATRTLDVSTWSGARSAMSSLTPETFDIPMSMLDAGSHSMWIRARATGTAGLREVVRTQMARIGSASIGTVSETTRLEAMPTTWGIYPLGWGDATLTTIDPKSAPNGFWRVILSCNAVDLDELLIYNEDTGSLLIVDCGAFNRLWVTNPSTDDPFPRIYVGTEADQSDARHAEMSAIGFFGKLNFLPGPQNVFTGSSAPNPACELRHPPHWHSHPAPIEAPA